MFELISTLGCAAAGAVAGAVKGATIGIAVGGLSVPIAGHRPAGHRWRRYRRSGRQQRRPPHRQAVSPAPALPSVLCGWEPFINNREVHAMFINFSNHPHALWSARAAGGGAALRHGGRSGFSRHRPRRRRGRAGLPCHGIRRPHPAPWPGRRALSGRVHLCVPGGPAAGSRGIPTLAACSRRQSQETTCPGRQHPEAQHLRLCRLSPLWLALKRDFNFSAAVV